MSPCPAQSELNLSALPPPVPELLRSMRRERSRQASIGGDMTSLALDATSPEIQQESGHLVWVCSKLTLWVLFLKVPKTLLRIQISNFPELAIDNHNTFPQELNWKWNDDKDHPHQGGRGNDKKRKHNNIHQNNHSWASQEQVRGKQAEICWPTRSTFTSRAAAKYDVIKESDDVIRGREFVRWGG